MFLTAEGIQHDHELGFVQGVSFIVSLSTTALSHSLHALGCPMAAAKAQGHESEDSHYALKISKMYVLLLRNDLNDPSVLLI
jgi:hypothetical protein